MPARVVNYSTTLPSGRIGWRRGLAYTASGVFHVVLLVLIILRTARQNQQAGHQGQQETVRPVQLDFAPPRPAATPRPPNPEPQAQQPLPPPIPIAPGPDKTPGSTAPVTPTPEERPNADPNTARTEATRPDPGDADRVATPSAKPPPPNIASPSSSSARPASATMETEAQRIFGRPSSKLGPVSGRSDNRPWESPVELASRGCTASAEDEKPDSTLPPGMGVVMGKIYDERTGKPLADARLQILGTQYGAFANEQGEYKLLFDRKLVDRCRSQSVRVSAPGYPSRDVLLYIGATPNGDVPLSRY